MNKKHPSLVVLRALLSGLSIQLPGLGYKVVLDGEKNLCVLGTRGDEPVYIRTDMDLSFFIKKCECCTKEDIFGIAANIVLNEKQDVHPISHSIPAGPRKPGSLLDWCEKQLVGEPLRPDFLERNVSSVIRQWALHHFATETRKQSLPGVPGVIVPSTIIPNTPNNGLHYRVRVNPLYGIDILACDGRSGYAAVHGQLPPQDMSDDALREYGDDVSEGLPGTDYIDVYC